MLPPLLLLLLLLLLWRELDRLLPLRVTDVTMIAGVHVSRQ